MLQYGKDGYDLWYVYSVLYVACLLSFAIEHEAAGMSIGIRSKLQLHHL